MPDCPLCGAPMRQVNRGATYRKHGPGYVCPVDEGEEKWDDARRRYYRDPGAKHPYLRKWSLDELEAQQAEQY